MRVLHIFKVYFPDSSSGVEQVIYNIAQSTKKLGVTTDVLSLTDGEPNTIEIDNEHYSHRAKQDIYIASTGFSISVFSRFKKLANEADLIHYHYPWPMMDIVHLTSTINKPTIVTYHSDIVKQKHLLRLYRPLQNCFLGSVDKIVATSPNYVGSSDVLKKFESKIVTIPIGLDKYSYPQPNNARLEYWQSLYGNKFFLFVGVLRYYKGLHILIEAAIDTEFPILIAGCGPLEVELKRQVEQLGLKNIHFLGRVSDIDKVALLQLCFAFVFPSHLRSEAFGVSLLEAAMYGKPLISTEMGTGTSYINLEHETGFVVPPANPQMLREAMLKLWSDPKLAIEMGKKAEKRYWQLFTAENMAAKYVALYRELIELHQS